MFFSLTLEKLAAYNLGEEIGQGGFGCVFGGTRKVDNLPVSTVHEQLTVVSLEYKNARLRGSPVFARDLMIPSRSTAPGFS